MARTRKTVKADRRAEYNIRCGICRKKMPKGTMVYRIKPTDWRKSWAMYVTGCKKCAEKEGGKQ